MSSWCVSLSGCCTLFITEGIGVCRSAGDCVLLCVQVDAPMGIFWTFQGKLSQLSVTIFVHYDRNDI